jgi:hypothetical protein
MAKVTEDNVFKELGFDASESADLALRAYLMSEIRKFINANDLTQMSFCFNEGVYPCAGSISCISCRSRRDKDHCGRSWVPAAQPF